MAQIKKTTRASRKNGTKGGRPICKIPVQQVDVETTDDFLIPCWYCFTVLTEKEYANHIYNFCEQYPNKNNC